jgi:hypothetical protein
MITLQLTGGLGNQLFQYAAAMALAKRRQVPLQLDLSRMPFAEGRILKLDAFQTEAAVLELKKPDGDGFGPGLVGKVRRRLDPRKAWYKRRVVEQPHFHYAPDFFKAGPNAILYGYWQSPQYFAGLEPLIRDHYRFRAEFDRPTPLDEKVGSGVVALHVRRGDYVSNPIYSKKYRVMELDYYVRAVEKLSARTNYDRLVVFSDDLPWCQENLVDLGVECLDGGSDLGDFRLMRKCSHHIISNSTFAWWAAYLGEDPKQVVIAPNLWFLDDRNTSDLFPNSWLLI